MKIISTTIHYTVQDILEGLKRNDLHRVGNLIVNDCGAKIGLYVEI